MLPAVRTGVVVATKGRPQAISQLMRLLERQSRPPSKVLLSATDRSDVEIERLASLDVECIFGKAGSAAQRNRALNRVRACCDVVIFFDDDFAPSRFWIEHCRSIFESEAGVVGVSGVLIRDGAKADEISWEEAKRLIDDPSTVLSNRRNLVECADLYGCNMAYRTSAIHDMAFDERLVLYGWLEDMDFSRRVKQKGRLVQCNLMSGVHLGIKRGRVSGKIFGYSQIVNACYLHRKGTLSSKEVRRHIFKAFAANGIRALHPERNIDRRGRLIGNLIGVSHLLSGDCRPEKAAEL
jgi:GT2 family glycosyltransferase